MVQFKVFEDDLNCVVNKSHSNKHKDLYEDMTLEFRCIYFFYTGLFCMRNSPRYHGKRLRFLRRLPITSLAQPNKATVHQQRFGIIFKLKVKSNRVEEIGR